MLCSKITCIEALENFKEKLIERCNLKDNLMTTVMFQMDSIAEHRESEYGLGWYVNNIRPIKVQSIKYTCRYISYRIMVSLVYVLISS